MPRVKERLALTDKIVGRLGKLDAGFYMVQDLKCRHLFLRVGRHHKTWSVHFQRRINGARTGFTETLGHWPHIHTDPARKLAQGHALRGVDYVPPKKGHAKRGQPIRGTASETLCQAMARHVRILKHGSRLAGKRPTWAKESARLYRAHLSPWAKLPLDKLVRAEVQSLHFKIGSTHGQSAADHALKVLRSCWNHAGDLYDLPATVITKGVKWFRVGIRTGAADRLIIPAGEMPQWRADVEALPDRTRALFHLTCLYTGGRPSEVSRMRPDNVDLLNQTITLVNTKTGADILIPTSKALLAILIEARDLSAAKRSPWLFPSPDSKSGHISTWRDKTLSHTGYSMRYRARTTMAGLGMPEALSKRLMGHVEATVHSGYIAQSDLDLGWLRDAQEKVSAKLTDMMVANATNKAN